MKKTPEKSVVEGRSVGMLAETHPVILSGAKANKEGESCAQLEDAEREIKNYRTTFAERWFSSITKTQKSASQFEDHFIKFFLEKNGQKT